MKKKAYGLQYKGCGKLNCSQHPTGKKFHRPAVITLRKNSDNSKGYEDMLNLVGGFLNHDVHTDNWNVGFIIYCTICCYVIE